MSWVRTGMLDLICCIGMIGVELDFGGVQTPMLVLWGKIYAYYGTRAKGVLVPDNYVLEWNYSLHITRVC